jgi:AMP-polyphosphate phosphotransferase
MGKKGGALARLDLSLELTPKQEAARLAVAQARLLQLRLVLGGQIGPDPRIGPPVCVVFEGWDASGKGGAIKRLVEPLDPRHVRVAQFGAPSYDEKRHHFLWRFWPVLPGWGGMSVLDRSWYGRVLVERVEGFATEEQWRRAYQEIVGFERTLVDEGMIIVKFWLHLSAGEQLKRFKARERDPLKTWKLTPEDWRNRGKRRQYEAAVEEMLDRTDHAAASWVLVEAEDKRWARVKVVESVVAAIETGMAARNLPVPPPQPDRQPRLRRPRLHHPRVHHRAYAVPAYATPIRHECRVDVVQVAIALVPLRGFLVLLRSHYIPVTADPRSRPRSGPRIWRGCPIHVVPAA